MNRPSSPMHLSLLSEPIGPIDETDYAIDRQQQQVMFATDADGSNGDRQEMPMQQQQKETDVPAANWNNWDVPIGRGRAVREFIGNERYRDLVDEHRPTYLRAKKRKDKRDVSLTIYNIIRSNGGRFLAPCGTKDESWYQISKDKALAKIGQALRIGVRAPQPLYSSWSHPVENRRASESSSEASAHPLFVDVPRESPRLTNLEVNDSISNLSFSSEDPMLLSPYTSREFEFATQNDNTPRNDHGGNDCLSLDPGFF